MKIRRFALFASALTAVSTAGAHHGFGTFAMNEDIELSGVVTKLDFVNPHSWVEFNVTQEDGTVVPYRCEMRSATTLRRSGWSPEMFPAGTHIRIEGSPDRTDPHACYVSTLYLEDQGKALDRYEQLVSAEVDVERAARRPNGLPNLAGDWAVEQRIMTDPKGRDGTLVPLSQATDFGVGGVPEGQREIPGARGTPEAEVARDPNAPRPFRSLIALTPAGEAEMQRIAEIPRLERSCLAGSIVSDWGGEPVNRITQSDANDVITIAYGLHGRERTIDMRHTIHPTRATPSWTGHSIGWWDGDVLVVDTVGSEPGILVGTAPHSDRLHVVERFALDPDAMTLTRDFRAEDPLYLAEAYTGSTTMILSNVPYAAEACQDLTPIAPPAR
jgi:Family of unknown function (DUF6152)